MNNLNIYILLIINNIYWTLPLDPIEVIQDKNKDIKYPILQKDNQNTIHHKNINNNLQKNSHIKNKNSYNFNNKYIYMPLIYICLCCKCTCVQYNV
jgi:hypothetical protein